MNSIINSPYAQGRLSLFGGEIFEDRVAGPTDLPKKDGFHLSKPTSDDPEVIEIISADKQPYRTCRLYVFLTKFGRALKVQ